MRTPGIEFDLPTRTAVLDAAGELQHARRHAAARLAEGRELPGVTIVASGKDLSAETMRLARSWRELLSTRPGARADALSRTMPWNRELCETHGMQMISIFDYESAATDARYLLERDHSLDYRYGYAPVQMNIVDRRQVLLEGPTTSGGRSIMSVTVAPVLEHAWAYWHAVLDTARPCHDSTTDTELTERQKQIFELLSLDLGDDRVAALLNISARTVRADIAAGLRTLGVTSRFAAGYAYRSIGRQVR